MAILVLGGAGYIGSHTVYELIDAGRDVVVADNLLTGFRAAVHPKARFYRLDIRDRAAVDALLEREEIGGVIHFAASSQVGESMSDPLKYYDNNLGGTTVLLQSMVAHGIDKIVFSSTAAAYGEPERVPITEDDKTAPTNCYGETKLAMEKMMGWTERAHCDLAQAHILALDHLSRGGQSDVFNLGNGVGYTVMEVIDTARRVTGHAIPTQMCPPRAGDPAQLVASSAKAKRILGWTPRYDSLEDIVGTAWSWHKSHPHGFEEK